MAVLAQHSLNCNLKKSDNKTTVESITGRTWLPSHQQPSARYHRKPLAQGKGREEGEVWRRGTIKAERYINSRTLWSGWCHRYGD